MEGEKGELSDSASEKLGSWELQECCPQKYPSYLMTTPVSLPCHKEKVFYTGKEGGGKKVQFWLSWALGNAGYNWFSRVCPNVYVVLTDLSCSCSRGNIPFTSQL